MTTQQFAGGFSNDFTRRRLVLIACYLWIALTFNGIAQGGASLEGISRPAFGGPSLPEINLPNADLTAPFTILLNFNDAPTAGELAAFTAAKATWQSIITGYKESVAATTLTINVNLDPIDGAGGILGSAGPTHAKLGTSTYLYANAGSMTFDTADTSARETAGVLDEVIMHEMAHVIGVGTLWSSSAVGFPGYQELYPTRASTRAPSAWPPTTPSLARPVCQCLSSSVAVPALQMAIGMK